MQYIDEKFKDLPPEVTVENIISIIRSFGIELEEKWYDSGIENCYSLSVHIKDGYPSSNGKGVTKALARASAYAEFIERLQQGLHYYKLQSFIQDPEMNLHTYAPDGKYMTEQELVNDSEWMDYLIEAYGKTLTRKKIAQQCKVFSCTNEDKILTLPYYSVFEDKYVYLPAAFIEQVYVSNGCCAGNTMEEAFVHAISEIFERNRHLNVIINGKSYPKIPNEILHKYPTVSKILKQIQQRGDYDISILDISDGCGFPVVASRIINKNNHSYLVNAAADPVLEIAIQRTLTELLQGRNIDKFNAQRSSVILNLPTDVPISSNAWNTIESSNGLYTADFFCDVKNEISINTDIHNRTSKTNKELLKYVLSVCKKLKKPVYIRNYSYLGFNSYKVIIPGYSEGNWLQLTDPISEYAFGNDLRNTMLDISSANHQQLISLLMYRKLVSNKTGKTNNFSRMAGIPLKGAPSYFLLPITLAYAAYKLGRYNEASHYCSILAENKNLDQELTAYLLCVVMYLDLKQKEISLEKIELLLLKFHKAAIANTLISHIKSGDTPFDDLVLRCNLQNCQTCQYSKNCSYYKEKELIQKVGRHYNQFVNGQDIRLFRSYFNI